MNADGNVSRRDWIKTAGVAGLTAAATSGSGAAPAATRADQVTTIGSRRELFVDNALVGSITGWEKEGGPVLFNLARLKPSGE